MERGRLLSLKRKISQGKLREVAEEIFSYENPLPNDLVASIREGLADGQVLDSIALGKLVVRTRDRQLFELSGPRATIFGSPEVLCDLLRSGIPDKAIEQALCEALANDFEGGTITGRRQFMLEALRDFGSVSCLDTLEAIEYDFSPKSFVANTVLSGLPDMTPQLSPEFVNHLSAKADVYLGKLLRDAIASIRNRNEMVDDLWGIQASHGDQFSRSKKYRDSANHHLKENDLGASLNYLRKATEAMLKTSIQLQGIQPDKGDPVEKMQLPVLMAVLMGRKDGNPPPDKHIHKFLEQLRDSSTLGSHDQGEGTEEMFGPDMVKGQIEMFDKVLDYFRVYAGKQISP